MVSEAQKKADIKYKKENTVNTQFRLYKNTDGDLVDLFSKLGNRQGYIKALIRADMESDAPLYKQFQ